MPPMRGGERITPAWPVAAWVCRCLQGVCTSRWHKPSLLCLRSCSTQYSVRAVSRANTRLVLCHGASVRSRYWHYRLRSAWQPYNSFLLTSTPVVVFVSLVVTLFHPPK